ncbi:hypothetical protein PAT3040_00041 [Paenibacillus agaridevorans]|uniref:Glycoside hydrolase n=1 Tax=Paenibacillus agaridevorans TaxID=171404 RepID=A0A2R5EIW0_9BACL|nr:glycosyl hydrolase [Paenibacillus agaridevorans]GBG05559.1 hypothetical protein PAT3040_00041 [Paenibacillus agaridevorans]
MDTDAFREPQNSFRPSPFWAWNDMLADEELRRQVREMKKQGFGGYFMHSRVGLLTPYLSEEWMDRVAATLEEGKKLGMETWLYDEDKWPSGAAGGLVTAENEAFRAKYLLKIDIKVEEVGRYLADRDVVGVFKMFMQDGKPERYERVAGAEAADVRGVCDARLVAFKMMSQAPSAWYNHATYADLLNPEAVRQFLAITHERYESRFGAEFGAHLPGIFTDEPQFIGSEPNAMPWTTGFDHYFCELEGYELADVLPSLFYPCGDHHAIKYAYFKALTKRFIAAFSQPVFEFCERNGLQYTGHYFEEDSMYRQATSIGAAMPHYAYMHIPGIDHLCRQLTIPTDNADDRTSVQTPTPLTMKQVSSVAHQYGRKRVLSEIFGVSGHSMTFEDQKWLADYNFVLGITFLCQHLVLYAMTGDRKRDYPPTISYHQPYWDSYRIMNDYFARASWVCAQGEYMADTLVLHPIGSLWATFEKKHRFHIGHYDRLLIELTVHLLSCQVAFDFGDEIIMEHNAAIKEEVDGTAMMAVASAGKYKVVVVPPSLTWSENTVNLLERFADKGGKVVFVGDKPTHIDGRENAGRWKNLERLQNVYSVDAGCSGELKRILSGLLHREVKVEGLDGSETKDVYVHGRRDRHEYYYFVANTSKETAAQIRILLPTAGKLKRLDLFTGDMTDVCAAACPYGLEIDTFLATCGSIVYYVDASASFVPAEPVNWIAEYSIDLSPNWTFKRTHKNVLTLDYCRYSVDREAWSEEVPVWKIRRKMRQESGFGEYDGVQPWVVERNGVQQGEPRALQLSFQFRCKSEGQAVHIVIEQAHNWRLAINGHTVDTVTDEYYWDKQFGLIDISAYIRQGTNDILLACDYRYGIEIEDIYIVGDFGVVPTGGRSYALSDEPCGLTNGSWVGQGYPFYSGNIVYRNTVLLPELKDRRAILRLNDPKGTLFKVKVNQGSEQLLISRPWEIDITPFCITGDNTIEIEVVSSLRNTFGPLHHAFFNPVWCGPEAFEGEWNQVIYYQLEDYGLMDGATVIVKCPDSERL